MFHLTGSLAWVGLPAVFFYLGSALASYPAGRLMDRVGRLPVLVGGHVLAALGFLIGSLGVAAGTVPAFLAGHLIASLGAGTTYLTRLAAADLYPASQRARGMSLVVFASSIGALLGVPLLWLVQLTSGTLGQPYYLLAWGSVPFLSLLAAAFVAGIRRDPREVGLEIQAAAGADRAVAPNTLSHHPAVRPLALAGLSLVLAQAAMASLMAIAGASLDHAGHAPTLIGAVMTAHLMGMFFFTPWIGRFADRWGRRASLLVSAVLLSGATLSLAAVPTPEALALLLFVVGIGWSFSFIGATAIIADVTHVLRRGRATGLVDFGAAVGAALAAFGGGWLLSHGGLAAVGTFAAALTIGVWTGALLLRLPKAAPSTPRPEPEPG
jgi:MFS family permease